MYPYIHTQVVKWKSRKFVCIQEKFHVYFVTTLCRPSQTLWRSGKLFFVQPRHTHTHMEEETTFCSNYFFTKKKEGGGGKTWTWNFVVQFSSMSCSGRPLGSSRRSYTEFILFKNNNKKRNFLTVFVCVCVCPEGVLRNIDFIAGKNKNGNWPQRRMCHNTKERKTEPE